MIDHSDQIALPLPPAFGAYYGQTRRLDNFGSRWCQHARLAQKCGLCAVLRVKADEAYRAALGNDVVSTTRRFAGETACLDSTVNLESGNMGAPARTAIRRERDRTTSEVAR